MFKMALNLSFLASFNNSNNTVSTLVRAAPASLHFSNPISLFSFFRDDDRIRDDLDMIGCFFQIPGRLVYTDMRLNPCDEYIFGIQRSEFLHKPFIVTTTEAELADRLQVRQDAGHLRDRRSQALADSVLSRELESSVFVLL
jgi:hypothetical protein